MTIDWSRHSVLAILLSCFGVHSVIGQGLFQTFCVSILPPLGRLQFLPKIPPTGPIHFWWPNLQLWPCFQKVQSCLLQVGGCLPLPDLDTLHLQGNCTSGPLSNPRRLSVPSYTITSYPKYPPFPPISKTPNTPLSHLYSSSKSHIFFPSLLLETFWHFTQWWFLSPEPPFPSSNFS